MIKMLTLIRNIFLFFTMSYYYQKSTPHSSVHTSLLAISLSHEGFGSSTVAFREVVVIGIVEKVSIISEL